MPLAGPCEQNIDLVRNGAGPRRRLVPTSDGCVNRRLDIVITEIGPRAAHSILNLESKTRTPLRLPTAHPGVIRPLSRNGTQTSANDSGQVLGKDSSRAAESAALDSSRLPEPVRAIAGSSRLLGSRMDADQLLDYAAPRLLMHRILQVRPEFPFDDGNLAAVLQICSRLDSIPGMSRLYC